MSSLRVLPVPPITHRRQAFWAGALSAAGAGSALAITALGFWPAATLVLSLALVLVLAAVAGLYARLRAAARAEVEAANHLRSGAEDDCRRSDERFRQLIENAADPILLYDARFRWVEVNCRACQMLGYTREELLARSVPDVELPLAEADRADLQEQLLAGRPVTAEGVYRRKNGTTFPVEVRVTLLMLDGRPHKLVLVRDVTDRRRAEAELREQRDLLRDVIENIPCLVAWKDPDGAYRGCNSLFARARGSRRPDDVVGKTDRELGARPADAEAAERIERDVVRTRQPVHNVEGRARRPDGTEAVLLTSTVPLLDGRGRARGVLGVAADITERKRLEEKFLQAQKMEAVGRLAGGIAHDFNNLLTVINGHAQLLLLGLPDGDPRRDGIGQVLRAGERAAGLTAQLLAYSRRQVLQPRVVDPNQMVGNLERLLRRLIGEDVELATALSPAVLRVRVDPGQFEQVLMNLAVNARDAMPKGGRLTIATRNIDHRDLPVVPDSTYRPVPYVAVEVWDTGVGMDAATRAKIFEPFFTTKEVGKGTGLGLATVQGIVKQSGGLMDVESEAGRGTRFRIFLPADAGATEPVGESRFGQGECPRGSETVLVVEDEPEVLSLTRLLLQRAGYTVLTAAGGTAAVEAAARHAGRIDLLLTDVVMPRMNGRQLVDALRPRHPALRVLYMSGYTDDDAVRQVVQSQGAAFLQKPFTLSALAVKVREVLDDPLPGTGEHRKLQTA